MLSPDRDAPRPTVTGVLLVAAWLGLLSGVAEAVVYAVRQYVMGEFMVMNWHFPWMVPLAAVLLMLVLGVAALPVARWRWVPAGAPAAIFGLTFIACLGPARAIPGLAWYAALLLPLGLAVQTGRLCGWRFDRLHATARRSLSLLASLVLLAMTSMLVTEWAGERLAIARLPAPAPETPNVLLIVLDTVRAKNLGVYRYGRSTSPTIDRMAAEGVVFERALSTAPWTLPSHGSLFTGTYPHEHGADWSKPLDSRLPTLAELLRDRGYATGAFSANTLNVTRTHGLSRGFIHFEDLPVSLGGLALSTSIGRMIVSQGSLRHWLNYHEVADRQNAETITSNTLAWLTARQGRPFFAFLNYFDAHDPYLPPDPCATQFGPRRSPAARFWHTGVAAFPVDRETLPPAALQAEVDAYDGAIAFMDDQLNRLFNHLKAQGQWDNTLVIVTSDHGEQLGEHGLFNHGNSLYRPLVQVPLVMRLPGRIATGARIPQPVSIRDIPRTILDLLRDTGAGGFPGRSLAPYIAPGAGAPADEPILIEATRRPFGNNASYPLLKGDMRSLVAEGFEYIRNGDGTEELYNFDTDVDERVNLVRSPAHAAVLTRVRRLLADKFGLSPPKRTSR